MKLLLKKTLFLVLPLIVFVSVQRLKAQETVVFKVYTTDTIDVCTNERRVIVIVSLGKIEKKDSLLYFDLELKYDPTKVKFDQILTSGTLSEQFAGEMKAVGDFSGVGYARAFAGSFTDIPVSGDKPLIAFLGTSLSNCPDTSEVQLTYIDWVGFKRTISDTQNAIIIAREGKSVNRFIEINSTQDTLKFSDTIDTQAITLSMAGTTGTRFQEGILKVDYDRSRFKISEILPKTSNIDIVSIDTVESGIEIAFKNLDSNSQSNREIGAVLKRLKDTNEITELKSFLKRINDCSCVDVLKDTARVALVNTKQLINSIKIEANVFKNYTIRELGNTWVVDGEKGFKAIVYTILGQVKEYHGKESTRLVLQKENFETGTYILVLKNISDHSQEIRILNK